MSWMPCKVSFALLRSELLCLRGSRASKGVNLELSQTNLVIEKGLSNIRKDIENAALIPFLVRIRLTLKIVFLNRNELF